MNSRTNFKILIGACVFAFFMSFTINVEAHETVSTNEVDNVYGDVSSEESSLIYQYNVSVIQDSLLGGCSGAYVSSSADGYTIDVLEINGVYISIAPKNIIEKYSIVSDISLDNFNYYYELSREYGLEMVYDETTCTYSILEHACRTCYLKKVLGREATSSELVVFNNLITNNYINLANKGNTIVNANGMSLDTYTDYVIEGRIYCQGQRVL